MPITDLRFTNVGPFEDASFEFDDQVNVFTGPNNSGKSTVLWVLGEALVYPFTFPTKLLRPGSANFSVVLARALGTGKYARKHEGTLPIRIGIETGRDRSQTAEIGTGEPERIETRMKERTDFLSTLGYSVFIPALRRSTDFRAQGPIVQPTTEGERTGGESEEDYLGARSRLFWAMATARSIIGESDPQEQIIDSEVRKRRSLLSTSAALVSDEAVIQKIIELDYLGYRRHLPAIRGIIERIASAASEITEGFPIQFLGVGEDERGLFPQFRTPDGDVPLNVLSQGTQSIIQWLAHLLIGYAEYYDYPSDLERKPGILIIDEIDAHLHPSWQRRIIPTLLNHFPNLQIFCSTHSPLMLAGLKEGQVHLLKRDKKGKVTVTRNETDIIGWSADEILRNFLDVPSPTDLGTVKHIERLQELRRKDNLSVEESEQLEQLRHQVNQDLTGGPIAGQVERLADLLQQSKAQAPPQPELPAPSRPRTPRRRRSTS